MQLAYLGLSGDLALVGAGVGGECGADGEAPHARVGALAAREATVGRVGDGTDGQDVQVPDTDPRHLQTVSVLDCPQSICNQAIRDL